MSLGASPARVVRQILWRGLLLTAAGLAAGLAASLLSTRWLESQLYGISRTDAVTYAAATLLLFAVSALAVYLPARRATQVDPTEILRNE
jgi:ABC-type lipoprotein release transport system permease subunit